MENMKSTPMHSADSTTSSAANPLAQLYGLGQSIWFDYIKRSLLERGELTRMIDADRLMGVTSNPAIFEKAIATGDDYQKSIDTMRALCASDPKAAYERLAIADIQLACDQLAGVYKRTDKRDGYVSLEVSPKLANDTAGTLEEARRLWKSVARPNLMIKVPATKAGVPAVEALISEGVNVNVTLLFAVDAYIQVAHAYVRGLEKFVAGGGDPRGVASVASFFVSRVDTLVDAKLDALAKSTASSAVREACAKLRGKVGIANAKLAYQRYQELVAAPRWQALASKGAQTQRLLWASTGVKDPAYRDVMYVEELVGPDTVNTVPPQTLDAFREHGKPRASLVENTAAWLAHLREVETLGIALQPVCDQLLDEGVKLFDSAFDKLIAAVVAHGKPAAAASKGASRMAMIGLGRMGGNMARRLMRGGHEVVAFDLSADNVKALEKDGAKGALTYREVVAKLEKPRVCWVMVPAGDATEKVIDELAALLEPGDVIVDGGNSYFKDDIRRAQKLAAKGIEFVDAGTSGGVWGIDRGYCLMVGASPRAFDLLTPIFRTLAPGVGTIEKTPGREKKRGTAEEGFLHCGPVGAGHFVKMIHNGIEYGMMQAYAEGLDILKGAKTDKLPEAQRYDFDLADITELWRRGSVVTSWLLDLTAMALAESPKLEKYSGVVADSGEGRWTVIAAIEEAVPAPVLTESLYARFRSRQEHTFAEKVLSAMREKFGGHVEIKK
jgi:6-phosphogluconate dehydrogenase